jgi:hypothetical protein
MLRLWPWRADAPCGKPAPPLRSPPRIDGPPTLPRPRAARSTIVARWRAWCGVLCPFDARQPHLRARRSPAYLAAYDIHRAEVFGRCEQSTGIGPFMRLVEQVMGSEPYASAKRVFFIVDNGSSHRVDILGRLTHGLVGRPTGPGAGTSRSLNIATSMASRAVEVRADASFGPPTCISLCSSWRGGPGRPEAAEADPSDRPG